jgi:hypothetical protein
LAGLQRVAECGIGDVPGASDTRMTQPKVMRVETVEHGAFCEGCGVEITWAPILSEGRRYCCALCARGGDCGCGYAVEDEEEGGPVILES